MSGITDINIYKTREWGINGKETVYGKKYARVTGRPTGLSRAQATLGQCPAGQILLSINPARQGFALPQT